MATVQKDIEIAAEPAQVWSVAGDPADRRLVASARELARRR